MISRRKCVSLSHEWNNETCSCKTSMTFSISPA
ncbi:hypothetical protein EGJ22_01915 [Pseudomonas sp. p99-361]|nr:hypothetical protein DMX12_01985 [Pseudomonas sp. MB-090624]RRV24127.1 hypothetical protein EGJ22_01915 [Pseudomonas sp. p99-361]RRV78382.1 hypothetical protein EGJ15_00665 [Pseudomonas sp. p99-361]